MNSSNATADVTILVVSRERFSFAVESLSSVFQNTDAPFRLIYVDGWSPSQVKHFLQSQAEEKHFTFIRSERYLSRNQARNLGFAKVETKYTIFLENDVVVALGWLTALARCANETGASVVGPLYCIGRPYHQKIHMAAGRAHFEAHHGTRHSVEKHLMAHSWVKDVRDQLVRQHSERCEFHCALVRSDVLRTEAPLDERLLGIVETHADFCLLVRDAGGSVWFEPISIVTHVPPPPMRWSDLPYFLLRWSNEWTSSGRARFIEKWRLPMNSPDPGRHNQWYLSQRLRCVPPLWSALEALGMQGRIRLAGALLQVVDLLVTRQIARKHGFQDSTLAHNATL